MTPLGAFFDSYYRLRPVNATFTGVHDHDHRLPDWSPEGLGAALDEMRALRRVLSDSLQRLRPHRGPQRGPHARQPREGPERGSRAGVARLAADVGIRGEMSATARDGGAPSPVEKKIADLDLAIAFLDVQIAEHESDHFQRGNPSLAAGEAIFGIITLMTRPFAPTSQRVDTAIARLTAIPGFLHGARRSIADVPDAWRAKCLRECVGAGRLLGDGIRTWIAIESVDHRRAGHLTRAAAVAMQAFEDFRVWLERDAAAAPSDRCASGPKLFDLLLARGHWCDRAREQARACVLLGE